MSISFANALGIHEDALNFRAQRAEVLANNIAATKTGRIGVAQPARSRAASHSA